MYLNTFNPLLEPKMRKYKRIFQHSSYDSMRSAGFVLHILKETALF